MTSPARVASEIRRIRKQLKSPETLNNPQVSTELQQLYSQVIDGRDDRQGRHRLASGSSQGRPVHRAWQGQVILTPVRDADGLDLRPDPLTATTGAELTEMLRQYREWSGAPSFRRMAAQARQRVAHSTMYAALKSDDLPKQNVVLAIVMGCGGSEEDQRAFVTAWRRIKSGKLDSRPVTDQDSPADLPGQ